MRVYSRLAVCGLDSGAHRPLAGLILSAAVLQAEQRIRRAWPRDSWVKALPESWLKTQGWSKMVVNQLVLLLHCPSVRGAV